MDKKILDVLIKFGLVTNTCVDAEKYTDVDDLINKGIVTIPGAKSKIMELLEKSNVETPVVNEIVMNDPVTVIDTPEVVIPIDETPKSPEVIDETPVEEAPIEETPVEEPTVVETVDETPVEETIEVVEEVTEEAPKKKKSTKKAEQAE